MDGALDAAFPAPRDEVFVGREVACHLLDSLVSAAPQRGGAGVVVGEPGIGKTALLRRIAARSGAQVVWVRGMESEQALPFAAAADLLTPFRRHFRAVPVPQRRALERALALTDGPQPPPLAICAAALGVLSAGGDERPLAVLVDDLQWVDAESRQLLLFVARRLATEHVVMILALRDGGTGPAVHHDLPVLRLDGLDESECEALAKLCNLDLAPAEVSRLTRATAGNPLALLETFAHYGADRPGGPRIVVGEAVERAWRAVLDSLPARTRRALFLLTLRPIAGLPPLPEMLDAVSLGLADLEPAQARGLIRLSGGTVELRHPLLRQVLVDATPLSTKVETCTAVAARVRAPDVRSWMLSMAATGPDLELAVSLSFAAEQARSRGALAAASRLDRRAADLSPDPARRAGHLLAASRDALLAGRAADAERWSAELLASGDHDVMSEATVLRGRALTWMGRVGEAAHELVAAADRLEGSDPAAAAMVLEEALMPMAMAGDVTRCRAAALRSESLAPAGDASFHRSVMIAAACTLGGPGEKARAYRAHAEDVLSGGDGSWQPLAAAVLAQVRCWQDDVRAAADLAADLVEVLRRQGVSSVLAYALAVRSEVGLRGGRWAAAHADAVEAAQWAGELDQVGMVAYANALIARVDAARGDRALCEEHAELVAERVDVTGAESLLVHACAALGLAALGEGELDATVAHLEQAWSMARRSGLVNAGVVPFAADLVEAHLRRGDRERAEEVLRVLEGESGSAGVSYAVAGALRCRALMTPDVDDALGLLARARAEQGRAVMPFEEARTLLCEGETLIRARRPAAAVVPLQRAHDVFERLGARPWLERTGAELAAAGGSSGAAPRVGGATASLTPQELQIARAVASGLGNAETAAALFVSRKTVEAHLTHIYRKLHIRSRVQLTRLLLAEGLTD